MSSRASSSTAQPRSARRQRHKSTFASPKVVIRRELRRCDVVPFFRKPPLCILGIEACATSHHRYRELTTVGHTVRLMPPAYVKPYVK